MLHLPLDITHPSEAPGAAIALRVAGRTPKRGIASIGAADDADALRIDRSRLGEPIHAVVKIVLHLPAPLPFTFLGEVGAVAGRSPEIWLKHRISAVGEELHLRVK